MPKVLIDYANTIIYKLVHKDDLNDENIYTGHTTHFRNRKYEHKKACNNPKSKEYNQKKYQYIRENGGWDEWLMIEIEKYPCKDSHEATARERVIQTELKATLNMCIAGRTQNEWYVDNRDNILKYKKQYRQKNRDTLNEIQKKYSQDNRERYLEKITCEHCGSIISRANIAKHKKTQKCINFKPS